MEPQVGVFESKAVQFEFFEYKMAIIDARQRMLAIGVLFIAIMLSVNDVAARLSAHVIMLPCMIVLGIIAIEYHRLEHVWKMKIQEYTKQPVKGEKDRNHELWNQFNPIAWYGLAQDVFIACEMLCIIAIMTIVNLK